MGYDGMIHGEYELVDGVGTMGYDGMIHGECRNSKTVLELMVKNGIRSVRFK